MNLQRLCIVLSLCAGLPACAPETPMDLMDAAGRDVGSDALLPDTSTSDTGRGDAHSVDDAATDALINEDAETADASMRADTGTLPGVIFQENFDDQPEWSPAGTECNGRGGSRCGDDVPANWTYYRASDEWNDGTGHSDREPAIRISEDFHRGPSGRALVKSSESNHAAGTANYYSDGDLMKNLGAEYQELYLSVWILFDGNWEWAAGSPQMKLIRFLHFDGPDGEANPFKYFSDGHSSPIYIFVLRNSDEYGWRHGHAPRCSNHQMGNYYCTPNREHNKNFRYTDDPTFEESMGDGQWHNIELHVRMNSVPGANDGVFEFWLDGQLEHSVTTMQWRDANTPTATGWNTIALGGNWNNWYSDPSNRAEQWYAMDDLVVSTSPIRAAD